MSFPAFPLGICYLTLFHLVGFPILCHFISFLLLVAFAESLSLSLSIDAVQSYSLSKKEQSPGTLL